VLEGLEIVDEDPRSPVGWDLMDRLMDDVAERYGDDDRPADLVPDGTETDDGAFLVAYADGHAVGCAALRPVGAGVGELKRMYVDPKMRGHGIGAALLAAVEARAATLGYSRLTLETGLMQPEAVSLYASRGWERIEPYGQYKDSPLSVCFAKQL
jgi:GNAT superfamily N-acetyltransferase